MTVQDQLKRSIHLKKTPQRIVSLVPSQTELLCDLGLENNLVGVTKFCVHPRHIIKKSTVVGGTKQIHLDRIKALNPDIILCNKEENTKAIVEACESICNVHVSDVFTIGDSLDLINQYGRIFERELTASVIIDKIENEVSDFKIFIGDKPTFKVVYFIWRDPWMVVGNNTFIDYLLQINKFKNVYAAKTRYPKIDLDVLNPSDEVDFVLLSSEPFPFIETHKTELQDYYPNAKIILVDGEMFSWYSSRLIKAFKYFKKLHLAL